ncbi:hypothetical protein TSAR_004039 [Trichomalopsis sarcophagae]|uniref:Uncharacterized protein n=1 Tax=Trichomalopsis sarcophagae TaxID=543379 RepID=A0A232ETQ4_9HYME|nr:hypothetical protein TSAR_004039 [Trichomalopsis sarcophagae]
MTLASNAFSKSFSRPKGISPFAAVLAVLGVLVANSVTCFAAFNVAEYVKLGRSLGERHVQKRAPVPKAICETPGCIHAGE